MEVVRAAPADDPVERMLAGWRAMMDRVEANRSLIVAYIEALSQVARSDGVRAHMAASYERSRATLTEVVLESVPPGFEQHQHVIASFIVAVVDGLALQAVTDPERAPTGEQLEESLRLMFAAIRATEPR
jgi:hypothetical protein